MATLQKKLLWTAAAAAGAGGLAKLLYQVQPVELPVRGGLIRMPRGLHSRISDAVHSGDLVRASRLLGEGVRSGRVAYLKLDSGVPFGSVIRSAAFQKKSAEDPALAEAARLRAVRAKLLGRPGPALRFSRYLASNPRWAIPFAAGSLGTAATVAGKLRSAFRDYQYRQALQQGQLPPGVGVLQ